MEKGRGSTFASNTIWRLLQVTSSTVLTEIQIHFSPYSGRDGGFLLYVLCCILDFWKGCRIFLRLPSPFCYYSYDVNWSTHRSEEWVHILTSYTFPHTNFICFPTQHRLFSQSLCATTQRTVSHRKESMQNNNCTSLFIHILFNLGTA